MRKVRKKGFDFATLFDGACSPLIATEISVDEDGIYAASILSHNGFGPANALTARSSCRAYVEQELSDATMKLMQLGHNVYVCRTSRELRRAARRLWPAHVIETIESDCARNRAAAK